jgi:hypothetical protein
MLQTTKEKSAKDLNALIVSPTNVLSRQIYVQFLKFANDLPIKVEFLEPGISIDEGNICKLKFKSKISEYSGYDSTQIYLFTKKRKYYGKCFKEFTLAGS